MKKSAEQTDEKLELNINGSSQWLYIRGNREGAILLFVHGGPGFPLNPLSRAFEEPYKNDFLMVHWDQRGVGKSLKSTDFNQNFNLQQFVFDGLEVTREIRKRYPGRPVILIGHSWGSILGAKMVGKEPGLFKAYLSIGTNSDSKEIELYRFHFLKDYLQSKKECEDFDRLIELGPPPLSSVNTRSAADLFFKHIPFQWTWGPITQNQIESAIETSIAAGDYTSEELEETFSKSFPLSLEKLHHDYLNFIAPRDVPQIEVPVYFIQGGLDFNTPSSIAKKYFQVLQAPAGKHWFEFPEHGHMVMYEDPLKVLEILSKLLREF